MVEAVKIMKLVEERNDVKFELTHTPFGACAYFECGDAFPEQTKLICDEADAILKGPIGLSHEESKKFLSTLIRYRFACQKALGLQ